MDGINLVDVSLLPMAREGCTFASQMLDMEGEASNDIKKLVQI